MLILRPWTLPIVFAFSYNNLILNVEFVMEDEENVSGIGTEVGYETEEDAAKS